MKYYIGIGLLYFILTSFMLFTNNVNESLYAIKNILIPFNYETNQVIFINLIINYSFIITFIMNIVKSLGSLFEIQVFICQRAKREKAYIIFLKYTLKSILILLFIKFVIDLLLGGITSIIDFKILLEFYVLQLLTILIWIFIIFILFLYNINEKKISFMMIAVIFISQYLSFKLPLLNVLVIASKDTLSNFNFIVFMKVIIIICLILLSYYKFKKYELVGGIKND